LFAAAAGFDDVAGGLAVEAASANAYGAAVEVSATAASVAAKIAAVAGAIAGVAVVVAPVVVAVAVVATAAAIASAVAVAVVVDYPAAAPVVLLGSLGEPYLMTVTAWNVAIVYVNA